MARPLQPAFLRPLLLGEILACAAMTGIIWHVQLLTYPQFAEVGASEFTAYHDAHTRRIAWLVAPLMLAELGLALLAQARLHRRPGARLHAAALAALLAIWTLTGLVQVPQHRALPELGPAAIDALVLGNWPRTLLWSLRTWLLARLLLATTGQSPQPR